MKLWWRALPNPHYSMSSATAVLPRKQPYYTVAGLAGTGPPITSGTHLSVRLLHAEFTGALCPETWVVADGTVTPLIRGAKLEGAGEEHSEAVAAELAAALEEKVHPKALTLPPKFR